MQLNLETLRDIEELCLPDPMPPVPEILNRMRRLLVQLEIQQPRFESLRTDKQFEDLSLLKRRIAILKLRIEQVETDYPQPEPQPESPRNILKTQTQNPSKNPDIQHISNYFSPKHPETSLPPKSQISNSESPITDPPPQMPPQPPSEIPSPTLRLARVLQTAARRKKRSDDKFATLSPEDREQLMAWLNAMSFDAVLALAAKPRPEGLDFHTSRTALHHFYHKQDLNDRLQDAIDILEAAELEPGQSAPLEQTIELLVHAQAVRVAGSPDLRGPVLNQFMRHITRLRELKQREQAITIRQQSLAFRMQTFGYDAAAEAIKKLPELNEIVANRQLTPRQVMDKGFIKVFGQETYDMIQEGNRRARALKQNNIICQPKPDLTCLQPKQDPSKAIRVMSQYPDTPLHILKSKNAFDATEETQK